MKILKCLVILFFTAIGTNVVGAQLQLENYHNARVLSDSSVKAEDYVFAVGSYKKVAGAWRLDRQQRLSGELNRVTLELPERNSAKNGFEFYLDQLQNFNYRELFYCKGRDCGTSNSWANNHFKILQLYGLDQFQYYGAYEVTTADEHPFYVALYAVQRGNKRVYMQIDVLHVDSEIELGVASSVDSIIKAMNASGYYVFPDLIADDKKGEAKVNIKPAHLQALVDALAQKPDWQIAIVGHDYSVDNLAQQQKKSHIVAEQVHASLKKAGITEARMSVYGVGSLAPAGRGDRTARVEIVLIGH